MLHILEFSANCEIKINNEIVHESNKLLKMIIKQHPFTGVFAGNTCSFKSKSLT